MHTLCGATRAAPAGVRVTGTERRTVVEGPGGGAGFRFCTVRAARLCSSLDRTDTSKRSRQSIPLYVAPVKNLLGFEPVSAVAWGSLRAGRVPRPSGWWPAVWLSV